jgi:hypothetical protein
MTRSDSFKLEAKTISWIGATILAAAFLVRFAAAMGDLWLDEIWSIGLATRARSPFDILRITHDNNHPLNTLWLWLLGAGRASFLYRLPSVIAGMAAVVVAGLLARRKGRAEMLAAMVLVGGSFLLIQYTTEARGYSLGYMFVLLGLLALQHHFDDPDAIWATALFNAAMLMAFLSHFSTLTAYGAIGIWWLVVLLRRRSGLGPLIRDGLALHALPLAATLAVYLGFIRHMKIGGGPITEVLDVVRETAALSLGWSHTGWVGTVGAALAGVILIAGIGLLAARGDDRWVFYLLGIVLFPALALLLRQPFYVAPRYFIVGTVLFLLLLSELVGWLFRHGAPGRMAFVCVLAVFVVSNGILTFELLQYKRGHYRQAIEYILAATDTRPVQITSDYDFRNQMVLDYYSHTLSLEGQFAYTPFAVSLDTGPEWLILHRIGDREAEPPRINEWGEYRYEQQRIFRSSRLSGASWFVYRRLGSP